jgi:hypothetical protein
MTKFVPFNDIMYGPLFIVVTIVTMHVEYIISGNISVFTFLTFLKWSLIF